MLVSMHCTSQWYRSSCNQPPKDLEEGIVKLVLRFIAGSVDRKEAFASHDIVENRMENWGALKKEQ